MKITLNAQLTTDLVELLMDCDFDYDRIRIAENEKDNGGILFYLEDKENFAETLDDCVQVHVSNDDFAKFIAQERLNVHEAMVTKDSGKILAADIEVNNALDWYENDTTFYQRQTIQEAFIKDLLVNLTK